MGCSKVNKPFDGESLGSILQLSKVLISNVCSSKCFTFLLQSSQMHVACHVLTPAYADLIKTSTFKTFTTSPGPVYHGEAERKGQVSHSIEITEPRKSETCCQLTITGEEN